MSSLPIREPWRGRDDACRHRSAAWTTGWRRWRRAVGSSADNRIAFAFANDIGADPDKLCWIAAGQLGELYGLEPEYHCPDVTSYFSGPDGCGLKTFADFDAPCGTFSAKPTCSDTGGQPTQNSAALLAARAGLSDRIFLNEFEQARPAP